MTGLTRDSGSLIRSKVTGPALRKMAKSMKDSLRMESVMGRGRSNMRVGLARILGDGLTGVGVERARCNGPMDRLSTEISSKTT